ncbi:2-hydroxyacid dehydrogenase [Ammoniphilus resinae]|uniref:Glyoxylate reductase n=1 Tax=Ammoniphilus resinae TaxID=861532 RepID=A0ABS4GM88_9BACL|nr:D-glycerate dehydrogenase [Ammoniphilus resinae]MBP1931369.1 glyoxylate reductase [Ammoniphilus resinae]
MYSVFITRSLPDPIVEKIEQVAKVSMWEEEEVPVPQERLEKELEQADGILCLLTETIEEKLLLGADRLKIISNMAVGYNNIDVAAASKKGIMVTNTPGVLTETTADLTFALLMATARRIVESSTYLKNGKWQTWSPFQLTGQDVYGTTLGIIGMGRIGEAVARRAVGFGMNILYNNRSRNMEAEKQLGVIYTDFETLLRQSDFVCVLTPYTPETRNLIDREQLSWMKKTATLINTSRGGVVNEDALYEALVGHKIWAAGLDVFEEEPVPLNHPLLSLPQVVALPHIGSASIQTRMRMAELAAANLIDGLQGKKPKHLVNPAPSNIE